MQRFGGSLGLNTTFVSGALVKLVAQLATGRRYRDTRHHLLVLVGLVCGCFLGALMVLRAPAWAPAVPMVALAVAFGGAGCVVKRRGIPAGRDVMLVASRGFRLVPAVATQRCRNATLMVHKPAVSTTNECPPMNMQFRCGRPVCAEQVAPLADCADAAPHPPRGSRPAHRT